MFYLLKFYTSTTSSLSNSPSNSFNSSSRSTSFPRYSIKLDGNLQPIIGSLSQFLLTDVNFFKLSICKWHLLRLVSIPTKEKVISISIWDPITPKICWAKNPNVGNITSRFYHHRRWHLMSLTSNWYLLKTNSLSTSSSVGSLVLVIWSKYPNYNLVKKKSWLTQFIFNLTKGCKCSWHFTNIGYKDFLSHSTTRTIPCSLSTNEFIIWRLLNLGFNIKDITLWTFLFSYFFKNEREKFRTLITSLLMLEAKKDNSLEIMESSSIRFSNERIFFFLF